MATFVYTRFDTYRKKSRKTTKDTFLTVARTAEIEIHNGWVKDVCILCQETGEVWSGADEIQTMLKLVRKAVLQQQISLAKDDYLHKSIVVTASKKYEELPFNPEYGQYPWCKKQYARFFVVDIKNEIWL